jgi:hypothetical protein
MTLSCEKTRHESKQNHTHTTPTNNLLSPSLSYLSHNVEKSRTLEGDLCPLERSRQNIFREKVDAGIIDIDNTTPSYINSIRLKFWGRKKPVTFRDNYRNFAASLPTEREASGA